MLQNALMGRRTWRLAALLMAAFVVQGCYLLATHGPTPPAPLRPTIVGVIAKTTQDPIGYHARLTDGRVVDMPQHGTYKILGLVDMAGYLLVAGTNDGGFASALPPLGKGCWEAYIGPSDRPTVWDMGDSILFMDGIELPKAPGFTAAVAPHTLDGRLAWTLGQGDFGSLTPSSPTSFCANEQGQIVSADLRILWPPSQEPSTDPTPDPSAH